MRTEFPAETFPPTNRLPRNSNIGRGQWMIANTALKHGIITADGGDTLSFPSDANATAPLVACSEREQGGFRLRFRRQERSPNHYFFLIWLSS